VIGGGNSAIDAARMAMRLKEVESVTILYRRTRDEMPAFAEEIEAALQEGIVIQTLVSPVRVEGEEGRLTALYVLRCRGTLNGVRDSLIEAYRREPSRRVANELRAVLVELAHR